MMRIRLEKPGPPGSRLRKPLLLSLAFILLAAVVVAAQLPALAEAIVARGLQDDPIQTRLASYIQGHKDDHQKYVQRFNGRSLFNKPQPPPRPGPTGPPPPPPPPPIVEGTKGPPANYTGPAVMFVLGDEVWFRNGLTLSVGEESQGVKVLSSDPPWKVTLAHGGGQYDIELFKKIDLFKDNKPRAQRDFPGLKPAPQGAPAPAGRSEASP
jgi:hypothetical protein